MKKRLFVGIDLPLSHKDEFVKVQSLLTIPKARWVTKENLHLTIHFLGYIEEDHVPAISELMSNIASKFPSFELFYNQLIIAPPKKPPRLLWVLFKKEKEFERLSELVIDTTREFTSPRVRNKKIEIFAHVTLARFPYLSKKEVTLPKPNLKSLSIEQFHLFESKLSPKGPSYTIIETFNLS